MAIVFIIAMVLISLRFSGMYDIPGWVLLLPVFVPLIVVVWRGIRKKE